MRVVIHNGSAGWRERSPVAKAIATLFFGVFLAVGLWMTWLMLRGLVGAADRYRWEPATCTFVSSEWSEDESAAASQRYSARATYRYEWAGGEYSGETNETFASVGDAQRFRDRHAAGTASGCFVNPDAPSESSLRMPSPWSFLAILFPLVFVATGGIPIFLLWKPRRETPAAVPLVESLTARQKTPAWAGCVMVGFFLVFLLAGAAVIWFLLGRPLRQIVQAKAWLATPCTVESSEVVAHPGDDGTTYSALVRFRYLVGEREYQSDRYDFSTGSTGASEGYQEVVDRFPPGSSCTCFVDPADPTRAVIDRGFRKAYWIGLAGLPFFAVGVGGLLYLARAALAKPSSSGRPVKAAAVLAMGPVFLRPKSGPWKKLLTTLAVNLFWNGIVGVFIYVIARDWRSGQHEWMPVLILTPFVLIGLLILSGLPYALLALANPRPFLELERGACPPGESVGARFRWGGLVGRLDRVEIALEGKEAVTRTEQSGSKSSTSRQDKMFHRSILFDSGRGAGVTREAALAVQVPAETMHSFTSANNEVSWRLHVRGEIRNWPDVDEEFPFEVPPGRSAR